MNYRMEGQSFTDREAWLVYCVQHVGKAMEQAAQDLAYEQHPTVRTWRADEERWNAQWVRGVVLGEKALLRPIQPLRSDILAKDRWKPVRELSPEEAAKLVRSMDFRRRLPITPRLDERRHTNRDEYFQTMPQKVLDELAQSYWMLVHDWPMY